MRAWRDVRLLLVILDRSRGIGAGSQPAGEETVQIGWLSQAVKRTLPLSYLDQPPQDEGIQGARLGIADNDTTGHFTGQSFTLTEAIVPEDGDVAAGLRELAAKGIRLVVTDLAAPELCRSPACRRPRGSRSSMRLRRRSPARRGLPRQHSASAAEPGDARRRAGPIPGRQALAESLAGRRPWRRRPRIRRRHPPCRAEIPGAHRPGEALDVCPGRAAHRYRPFRDPGRGRALYPGHQLRRSGRRRRRGRVRR